jgi:vesicle coat complex subunit
MRDSRETAFLILTYINSMVQKDPSLFQTWIADFFVTNADPTFSRTLKLSILTNLANDSNIDRILREFKFYATQDDKEFVAATIQCIGKCAMRLPEVLFSTTPSTLRLSLTLLASCSRKISTVAFCSE